MKLINYRQSEAGRFLWQGPESGNEDIAQQMEEAEQSAEKDKACSEFSTELGDLASECPTPGETELYQKHLEFQRQQTELGSGSSKAGSYDGVDGRPSSNVDEDF